MDAPKPRIIPWTDLPAVEERVRALYSLAPSAPVPCDAAFLLDVIAELRAARAAPLPPTGSQDALAHTVVFTGLELLRNNGLPGQLREFIDRRFDAARQAIYNAAGVM